MGQKQLIAFARALAFGLARLTPAELRGGRAEAESSAVVGARREAVDAVCEELRGRGLPVWIGNVNASTQFVLTGRAQHALVIGAGTGGLLIGLGTALFVGAGLAFGFVFVGAGGRGINLYGAGLRVSAPHGEESGGNVPARGKSYAAG